MKWKFLQKLFRIWINFFRMYVIGVCCRKYTRNCVEMAIETQDYEADWAAIKSHVRQQSVKALLFVANWKIVVKIERSACHRPSKRLSRARPRSRPKTVTNETAFYSHGWQKRGNTLRYVPIIIDHVNLGCNQRILSFKIGKRHATNWTFFSSRCRTVCNLQLYAPLAI